MASAKERRKVARKMREMVIDDVVFFDDIVAEIIGVDYDNDNGCWNRLADLIDPGEDVSMSAYDLLSAEDREALRWVRGHGGLDEVRRDFQDAYNRRSELCAALGIDPDTGWSDAMACMGTRLMPEGMEWPRFEGGEPVTFGCRIDGEPRPVSRVCFVDGKWYVNESHRKHLVRHPMGERVKRPAPKALDSEGVECNAGDAVWWVHNKTGNFRIIRIDKYGKCVIHDDDPDEPCGMTVPSTELTHKRPVFDADGVEIPRGGHGLD